MNIPLGLLVVSVLLLLLLLPVAFLVGVRYGRQLEHDAESWRLGIHPRQISDLRVRPRSARRPFYSRDLQRELRAALDNPKKGDRR